MDDTQLHSIVSRGRSVFAAALEHGRKDMLVAAVAGTFLSAVGLVVLGGILYLFLLYLFWRLELREGRGPSFALFAGLYVVVVAALTAAGVWYEPKERYYFGLGRRGFRVDDPTTVSDDLDRAHAALGFLVVIPNFVRLNLSTLKDLVTTRGAPVDPNLAGGILVLAHDGEPPGRMLASYVRFGERGVAKAIDLLRVLRWVAVRGHRVELTGKGMEILRRTGLY